MLIRLAIVCALMFCAPLHADLKVGDDAPNFACRHDILHPQEAMTLAACKGDVIFIKEWQARDMESVKELPAIQKYWADRGGKGLHVFMIHRLDYEKYFDVMDICEEKGYTFCIPMGGFYSTNDFDKYRSDKKGDYRTTVVGVDGKIAFHGKSGWQEVLDAELKKCVYPGLTKQTVAKAVEPAANHLMKRAYGRALNEAAKLKDSADETIKADAALVISRCEGFAKALQARIDAAKESKHYLDAIKLCERMADEFATHELGKAAAAAAKAMRDDKSLKTEIKAAENLLRMIEANKKQKDRATRANALRSFAKAHPNTAAAADAEALAKAMDDSLKK